MSGYVRIHRALCGHPAFRNDAEAMAFAWMIAKAQWRPTRVRYKERGICLLRGQLAISVRDFAKAMDRDKAWIERLLKRLRSETMIEVRHETGVNVITICNYEQFQTEQDRRKTPDETRNETEARQGRDTEQGMEEGKKEISPAPKRGGGKTLIPANWQLPPVSSLPPKSRACAEQWTSDSYETEGEGFTLYWRSCGRMMKDWDATWANRVIARHSFVMQSQKMGNAPKGGKITDPEQIRKNQAALADLYDRQGRTNEADEIRRSLAA